MEISKYLLPPHMLRYNEISMYLKGEDTKRQVHKMHSFKMFITSVSFIFLIKLRWPRTKSLYYTHLQCFAFFTNRFQNWQSLSTKFKFFHAKSLKLAAPTCFFHNDVTVF